MDSAAAARERRKARLANGADRLSKITGKPVDESKLPKPRQASQAPPLSAPSTEPGVATSKPAQSPTAATKSAVNCAETDDPPDVLPGEIPGANYSSLANPFGSAGATTHVESKTSWINWSALHYYTMILLGLYACWNEYSLWKLFVAVEVAMLAAKYALDPSQEPGLLRTLLQFVPPQYGSKLKLPLFAVQAARIAYDDLCVVLFVWAGTAAYSTTI